MELLPFLYALLAALTGVSAGDRVALVERAPVSACAATVAPEQSQIVNQAAKPLPASGTRPLIRTLSAAPLAHWLDQSLTFDIPGYSVLRL